MDQKQVCVATNRAPRLVNKPGVAGAVLQSPLLLIYLFIHSLNHSWFVELSSLASHSCFSYLLNIVIFLNITLLKQGCSLEFLEIYIFFNNLSQHSLHMETPKYKLDDTRLDNIKI